MMESSVSTHSTTSSKEFITKPTSRSIWSSRSLFEEEEEEEEEEGEEGKATITPPTVVTAGSWVGEVTEVMRYEVV